MKEIILNEIKKIEKSLSVIKDSFKEDVFLKEGDNSNDVKTYQLMLKELIGAPLSGTGYFGPVTVDYTKKAYKHFNLVEHDYVTREFYDFLLKEMPKRDYAMDILFIRDKSEEPNSFKDNRKKITRPLTNDENVKIWDALKAMVLSANDPAPHLSYFNKAVQEGNVVNPPCATTCSQVLEYAGRKAGVSYFENIFANPKEFYPTHDIELSLYHLGWKYYHYKNHTAPKGSVGLWSRYTFCRDTWDECKDHSGHVFIIFDDKGPLVGDNTRRKNEGHGHLYRGKGNCVGFWVPPHVTPEKR